MSTLTTLLDLALPAAAGAGFLAGCLADVVGRRRLRGQRDQARRAALTDALTGLANRGGLVAGLRRLAKTRTPYALVLLDLDGFKQVNDTHGHDAGDSVLVEVATRLRDILDGHPDAVVARLGGDEFVLAAASPAPATSQLLGYDVIRALARPVGVPGVGPVTVRASVGVAHAMAGDDPSRAQHAADIAMYQAKLTHGGNTVVEHDPVDALSEVQCRPVVRHRDMAAFTRSLSGVGT